jgi:hypothetical protein
MPPVAKIRSLLLACGTFLLTAFALAAETPLAGGSCYRVSLNVKPLWISGGAWSEETGHLVIVDPFQGKLISYDSNGIGSELAGPKSADPAPPPIVKVVKTAAGGIAERVDGSLLRLDPAYGSQGEIAQPLVKAGGGYSVGALYQWTATPGGTAIIAYGALRNARNEFDMGFFRLRLRDGVASRPEPLKAFENGDYYLLGYPFLVSLSDHEQFFVTVGNVDRKKDDTALYRVRPEDRRPKKMEAFPDGFGPSPLFKTQMTGPNSAPAHYAEFESFNVVSGLYAHQGSLFLLTRSPDDNGGTKWLLHKIDVKKDKVVGQVRLPTRSPEITIVPARDSWYVLERGTVGKGQKQDNGKMLVIDSAAVSKLAIPDTCPDR